MLIKENYQHTFLMQIRHVFKMCVIWSTNWWNWTGIIKGRRWRRVVCGASTRFNLHSYRGNRLCTNYLRVTWHTLSLNVTHQTKMMSGREKRWCWLSDEDWLFNFSLSWSRRAHNCRCKIQFFEQVCMNCTKTFQPKSFKEPTLMRL